MNTQPLLFFNEGSKGKVYDIVGGSRFSKRLFEMGFNTGQEVEIIKNDIGPLIIGLDGSRVAIGRGMAQKIILIPL